MNMNNTLFSHIMKFFIMIVIMSGLMACREVALVHDLNERDANEIVVLLAKNNIKAIKQSEVRNQDVFWIIKTDPSYELQARSILVSNNLPRIRQGGLEGICKDTGLILTPKTERCRELLAFKGEIINSLESIPGVVSADVVLNIPEKDDFPDENAPQPRPKASVTIQYLNDANVQTRLTEGKVQEFVANSIADLDARDVSVIISYFAQKLDPEFMLQQQQQQQLQQQQQGTKNTTPPDKIETTPQDGTTPNDVVADDISEHEYVSVGGIQMDSESAQKFKLIAALFLIVLLLVAAGFIFTLIRMSRLRRQSSVPAVIEGSGSPQGRSEDQKFLE